MSSDRVSVLLGILSAHPEGMDTADLFAKLRDTWPYMTAAQAQRVLDDAGPIIRVEGTRVSLVTVVADESPSTPRVGIRAVALDCETAVRLIPTKPYTDARIFQVAAVRFGTDTKWVEKEPALDRFMRLPEGFDVFDATVTARYEANAADCTEVLEVLRAYLADADVVVAYNGHKADFDFLDRACDLADIDRLDEPARCDGLYLALCMYPQGSMPHALRPLADAVGLDTSGMTWHDALDDSIVLARLINHLADRFSAMAQEQRALIGALCADSVAWRLLFALAGLGTPQSQAVGDAEVADVIERGLSEAPIRRRAKTSVGAIPATLKGPAGEVDPYRVALAARPDAQIRESQEEMGKVLREWIASGLDGLCEAPTGIGKSYVTIACALDWLEQHPWGRVVIATHTKQLQSQLVSELESLAFGDLAWLRQATGLVKGARNRLSLRALVQALADCSMEVAESRLPRHRMFRTVIHRELLVYLLLRLWATPRNLNDEWESRSVDPMDVPGFFESYTDEHVGRWLLPLSQADADDYHPHRVGRPSTLSAGADAAEMQAQTPEEAGGSMAPPPDPLSTHTEFVPEAIERYRLVVTNHALLMAHLDCVSDPAGTLLIVDEAHAIEGAATEALSQSVSYQTFEQLKSDVEHLSRELSKALDTRGLSEVARSLEEVLRTEMLPHSIQRIFDQVSGPPGVTGALRQGTLASWWGGDQARRDVMRAFSYLRRLSGTVSHLCQICRAISPSLDNLPRSDQQRFWAVRARAETMSTACAEVLGVADAILGPFTPPPAAVASGEQGIGGQTDIADTFEGENQGTPSDENPDGVDTNHIAADEAGDEDVSPVVDDDLSEETADTAPDGRDSPPPPSTRRRLAQNRIVWAAEMPGSDLIHGGRHYHFSLHASPVELPAEPEWARLRPAFARSIWISATLTVAGRFDFIRSRLGFGADVAERRLPASFNYKDHARLYVMSDFPSWSEHEVQAVRTLSWQTAGFCPR